MSLKVNPQSSGSSITDVAARAKVSTATVSRVLTGRRAKDDEIAQRVRQAAEELRYSVNYAASALRSDITNTLGVVIPDPADSFVSNMLVELETAASDTGKQLLVGIGSDAPTQNRRIETAISRRVDALLVIPSRDANLSSLLDGFVGMVPMVQISGQSTSFHINWVGVDERASMELALTHLSERNSHAIAFFSSCVDSNAAAELFATFQSLSNLLNLFTEPSWTTFGERTMRRGYEDAKRLFEAKGNLPDAIICADDVVAVGAMLALKELGVAVPGNVKVIGSGDSALTGITTPTLTSLHPPYHHIAEEALRLIANGNASQHRLPAHIAFPPELVQRGSTRTPRIGSSDMVEPAEDPAY